MSKLTTACCEKCKERRVGKSLGDAGFSCSNLNCPCHATMSKLTTALEAERERFEKDLDFNVMLERYTSGYVAEISEKMIEEIHNKITASHLRILSAVEEWAREEQEKYEEWAVNSKRSGKLVYIGKGLAWQDIVSALQEARSNIK